MEALKRHPWPGNVRELHNVLERAVMNTDEHRLEVGDFHGLDKQPLRPGPSLPEAPNGVSYAESMARAERQILEAALAAAGGKVAEAARRLGIGRATFYKRMIALGRLSPKGDPPPDGDMAGRAASQQA
jgi:DNA-binding NtrC family response regulator